MNKKLLFLLGVYSAGVLTSMVYNKKTSDELNQELSNENEISNKGKIIAKNYIEVHQNLVNDLKKALLTDENKKKVNDLIYDYKEKGHELVAEIKVKGEEYFDEGFKKLENYTNEQIDNVKKSLTKENFEEFKKEVGKSFENFKKKLEDLDK